MYIRVWHFIKVDGKFGLNSSTLTLIHICPVLFFVSGGILMRVPTMNSVAALAFRLKNLYMYCVCSLFNNAE